MLWAALLKQLHFEDIKKQYIYDAKNKNMTLKFHVRGLNIKTYWAQTSQAFKRHLPS